MLQEHIIEKLKKIPEPEALALLSLLPAATCSSMEWKKRAREVKIHRSFERMNLSALLAAKLSDSFERFKNLTQKVWTLRQ